MNGELEHLRAAVAAAQIGTWDWNLATGRVTWGGRLPELFGFSAQEPELHFEALIARLHEDDRPTVRAAIRDALGTGKPFEAQMRVAASGGASRWLLGRGALYTKQDGTQHMIGTTTDITESKSLETKLQQVSEVQRRFVSDVSHELRAPLTTIIGNLELMRRFPDMEQAEHERALRDAHSEARRLARLITDLLALVRGQSESVAASDPIALDGLVLAAIEGVRHLVTDQRLEHDPLVPARIEGDADRLRQLLLILLDNALKYAPGGRVHIGMDVDHGWVRLQVRDSGIGIPREELERVFGRFYRTRESRLLDPSGTGLGLAIAKSIVEAHGGEIRLDSEAGQGTVVTVRLPLLEGREKGNIQR